MKRRIALLLAFLFVFSLPACSGNSSVLSEENAAAESNTWHFVLGTPLTYETEITAEDGTLLLTEKYELPFLTLADENGNEADLSTNAPAQAEICLAFNAEIQDVNDEIAATVAQRTADAKALYAERTADSADWVPFAEELTIGETYLTDRLLSVAENVYEDLGGAHPSSSTRVWNFDLTTGEFVTLSTLTGEENPLGEIVINALSAAVFDDIREQNLSDGYFDTYVETVRDLVHTAKFYLNENGLVLFFENYVLAPYAMGPQAFQIPYGQFYFALNSHMQEQIALSAEDVVTSDYQTAEVFWSWFHMAMPPSDVNDVLDLDTQPRYRVKLGNVKTLEELRALLCTRIDEKLAEEWLAQGNFTEENGKLYCAMGERGGNLMIGKFTYEVVWEGEGGTVLQTVHYQDYDEATEDFVLTGETEQISYPFTLNADGHAVFTAFPCPL